MPIRVEHQPAPYAVGMAAYYTGVRGARLRQQKYAMDMDRDRKQLQARRQGQFMDFKYNEELNRQRQATQEQNLMRAREWELSDTAEARKATQDAAKQQHDWGVEEDARHAQERQDEYVERAETAGELQMSGPTKAVVDDLEKGYVDQTKAGKLDEETKNALRVEIDRKIREAKRHGMEKVPGDELYKRSARVIDKKDGSLRAPRPGEEPEFFIQPDGTRIENPDRIAAAKQAEKEEQAREKQSALEREQEREDARRVDQMTKDILADPANTRNDVEARVHAWDIINNERKGRKAYKENQAAPANVEVNEDGVGTEVPAGGKPAAPLGEFEPLPDALPAANPPSAQTPPTAAVPPPAGAAHIPIAPVGGTVTGPISRPIPVAPVGGTVEGPTTRPIPIAPAGGAPAPTDSSDDGDFMMLPITNRRKSAQTPSAQTAPVAPAPPPPQPPESSDVALPRMPYWESSPPPPVPYSDTSGAVAVPSQQRQVELDTRRANRVQHSAQKHAERERRLFFKRGVIPSTAQRLGDDMVIYDGRIYGRKKK